MASTITIICPECEKSIKAPEDVVGKKIRCKGCGETFTAKAPKGKPKPKARKTGDEEEEGAYGITEEYLGPRCPHCASAMDEGEIICLHCGYNTMTRERPKQRKVREVTGGDVFLWLLPGIACVILIITLLTFHMLYIFLVDRATFGGDEGWFGFLGGMPGKVWFTVILLFIFYYAGKFSIKRLILNNQPPEIEEKWGGSG